MVVQYTVQILGPTSGAHFVLVSKELTIRSIVER